MGKIWRIGSKALRDLAIALNPSPLTPIVGNLAFSPGLCYPGFQNLKAAGLFQAGHFGQWITRQRITEDPRFERLSFWQKLKLEHFLGSLPSPRSFTMLEFLCVEHSPLRHAISQTYHLLVFPSPGFKLPYIDKWERDLGLTFTDKQGERILLFSYKTFDPDKID